MLGTSIVDRHGEVVWQSIALHHGRDALLYSGYREASRSGGNKSRVQHLTSRSQLHDKAIESIDFGVIRRERFRAVVAMQVTLPETFDERPRSINRQPDRREFLDLLDEVDVLSAKVPIPIGGPGRLNQAD